ncbi:MAG: class I SAM-dependent methyltransferase [Anaerolineae bacterium]|nr:class I SAM-dependent methyltransferase [Anaerolineae bacterium]
MTATDVFDQNTAEYDAWFDANLLVYQAEMETVRALLPSNGVGIEVGVGTGRFAEPLGVKIGLEPARRMARMAQDRGIDVCQGVGESLPFPSEQFDFVLLITVDCFVCDLAPLLGEARRIIRPEGSLILGAVDRASPIGRMYEANKHTDTFYREAYLRSADEIVTSVLAAGFRLDRTRQTIIGTPGQGADTSNVQVGFGPEAFEVHEGLGQGAFIALDARKQPSNRSIQEE